VEIVTAMDTSTGRILWEHSTPTTFRSEAPEMGNGPYSTPLLAGDRVFTAGVSGRLQCLDKMTGKLLWTQMLWGDHGGTQLMYGYASSPIAFRETIIVPAGGKGKSTIAFQQANGDVAWAKGSIPNTYSSPLMINVDGLEQVGRSHGRAGVRTESSERRSAMANSVQSGLRDRGWLLRCGVREICYSFPPSMGRDQR